MINSKKEKKAITDIHVVRDFPEVFPIELPRLQPERQVEFLTDLLLGTMPTGKAPYHLTPIEMK